MPTSKTTVWVQIAMGVAASVLATILVGGVAFANEMENRTQALEITSKAQAQTIRDQRQKIKDLGTKIDEVDSKIQRMDKMLTFLATKAGYVPPEMGATDGR